MSSRWSGDICTVFPCVGWLASASPTHFRSILARPCRIKCCSDHIQQVTLTRGVREKGCVCEKRCVCHALRLVSLRADSVSEFLHGLSVQSGLVCSPSDKFYLKGSLLARLIYLSSSSPLHYHPISLRAKNASFKISLTRLVSRTRLECSG